MEAQFMRGHSISSKGKAKIETFTGALGNLTRSPGKREVAGRAVSPVRLSGAVSSGAPQYSVKLGAEQQRKWFTNTYVTLTPFNRF